MVLHCAGAGEQHLRCQGWCSDGQQQLRDGCGAAPASAVQQYLLGRQQPAGVFSSSFDEAPNAGGGASSNLAGLSVVEETLAGIWALEEDADGGVLLPLASTPVVSDEGSLEIRRDQPLLHQQHLQSYGGNVTATTYPPANEHERYVRIVEDSFNGGLAVDGSGNGSKAAGSYCSGGALGFGGGDRGGGVTGVGQTAAVSPKSSISSDGSGGDMVGNSPSAVWEVDIVQRGASKGGGGGGGSGGGGSGGGGRKRTLDAANEQVLEQWQPQLVDSRASLRDIEQGIDAIKQLFHCANMELESCLTVDEAEIRNRDEKVKQLLQLLRVTSLERDEARDQLQRLLSKMQATPLEQSSDQLHPGLVSAARPRYDLDGPRRTHTYPTHGLPYWSESARFSRIVANQRKPDSPDSRANQTDSHRFPCESARFMGIESDHRESDSPDSHDAVNLDPTYASSAVDGSPPALPHKVMAVTGYTTVVQQRAPPLPESAAGAMPMPPPPAAEFDPASAVIDRLVLKRALPEKGKLLQAVMDAGPLLQTLLVAGSLPRWRNPPPLQPFQIPPVAVRGRESGILGQNAVLGQNYVVQSSPPAFQNRNSPAAPSPVYSGSSGSGAFVLRGATPASCAGSYHVPAGKRQKF